MIKKESLSESNLNVTVTFTYYVDKCETLAFLLLLWVKIFGLFANQ